VWDFSQNNFYIHVYFFPVRGDPSTSSGVNARLTSKALAQDGSNHIERLLHGSTDLLQTELEHFCEISN